MLLRLTRLKTQVEKSVLIRKIRLIRFQKNKKSDQQGRYGGGFLAKGGCIYHLDDLEI